MATCTLCLENKKLIKAHIIPDFNFKKIYDKKHKLYKVPLNITPDFVTKKVSMSEYDKNLLCKECDNKLSKFESYFDKVLNGGSFINSELPEYMQQQNQHGIRSILIKNINYKLTKLYLISLLWRASATSRSNYKDIKLIQIEENKLREMLFYEKPGEPEDYPCILMTYIKNSNLPDDMVMPPRRNLENTRYTFLISGIIYTFFVSINDRPNWLYEGIVNKSKEMRIFYIPENKSKQYLNNFLGFEYFSDSK
jgi:hypothetical protein